MSPGRRSAFVLAVTGAVLACSGGVAWADETVVSAEVYNGASGGPTTESVLFSTLNGCTLYGGGALTLGNQSYQPATNSSWALENVLTCGLSIPSSSINSVVVVNPNGGFEAPLSSAQLKDPSQWADPASPNALPLISVEAAEDQGTYVRPISGPGDNNAADQIVENAPISIIVQEGTVSLSVNPTDQSLPSNTFAFSATVTKSDGTPVSGALTWSWNFGDGTTSTSATPTHQFAQPGSYSVAVLVTDTTDGLQGTHTFVVNVGSGSPGSGGTPHTGGTHGTPKGAPTGPSKSKGNTPGGRAGNTNTPSSSGTSHGGSPASRANTGSSHHNSTGASSPSSTAATTQSHPSTQVRPHARPAKKQPAVSAHSALVAGRLLGAVTPLPASESPLVHTVPRAVATAPAVRRAIAGSTSTGAGIAAGLGVVVLFGLGAGRELRWRRDGRLPRRGR